MEPKRSKYDTNPLDPDYVKNTEEVWSSGDDAPSTQEVKVLLARLDPLQTKTRGAISILKLPRADTITYQLRHPIRQFLCRQHFLNLHLINHQLHHLSRAMQDRLVARSRDLDCLKSGR